MRTGLVRCYGEKDTVEEYIDVAIKHFRCSREVRNTALKMNHYIAQQPTPISDLYKSMLAMTVVLLSSIENNQRIRSKLWSGECSCSYNTQLIHAKDIKKLLDESNLFPNLKRIRIGANL